MKPYQRLAQVTFFIFLFFAIFGTSVPFQDSLQEAEDISTSNPVNQLVFVTVFMGSLISAYAVRDKIAAIIKKELFLTLFFAWCLFSLLWSDYPIVSFKRLFQILTGYLAILSYLGHSESDRQFLRPFKVVVYLYIPLTLFAVLLIPGARDPVLHSFRGFAPQKNLLGQITLSCAILCTIFLANEQRLIQKVMAAVVGSISIFLLLGAQSSTSMLNAVILFSLANLFFFTSILEPLKIRTTYILFLFGFGVLFALSVWLFTPEAVEMVPGLFDKDLSFSGRTDLWQMILDEIKTHPMLGTGYQSFWIVGTPPIEAIHSIFIWIPLQSHNGYLDILNELGIVGLGLFLVTLIHYFFSLIRDGFRHQWKWFVIMILVYNLQETTFFRPGHVTSIFFIIAYLKFFSDSVRPDLNTAETQYAV